MNRYEIDTALVCLERSKEAAEDGEMTRAKMNAKAAALLLEVEEAEKERADALKQANPRRQP